MPQKELTCYKTALLGMTVVTARLLQKQARPKKRKRKELDLPWSEVERYIDEWIHSESDRQLLKSKLHNEDLTFEQLAEIHCTSVQNVKKKFYRAEARLYSKLQV